MNSPIIYNSPYPTPYVPTAISVPQFLSRSNPDDVPLSKVILSDFENPERSLTLGELRHNNARDASVFKSELGLQEGDVICIYAGNSVRWVSLAHAVIWAGGCICGINSLATSFELTHYLAVAQPKMLAVEPDLLPNVRQALKSLGFRQNQVTLILMGDEDCRLHKDIIKFPGDFRSSKASIPPFDLSARDNRKAAAGMCFSSGTSGKPKGVVYSHHNIIAQLLSVRATNPFTHNAYMREAFFPSFSHIYGMVSAVMLPAWVGNYVQAMPKFEYLAYLQRCAELKATVLRLVPAVAIKMSKDPAIRKLDLRSVDTVMCSGAPLSEGTAAVLQELLGPEVKILNGYGMSECTITLLRDTRDGAKMASVGKPSAGMAIRVVDDDFNDVPVGIEGQCLVRGPTVFMGYKNNPEETANTMRDGWLCSGDIVKVDEDGFFWLTGRKKELIKYKGNQIAPAELEAILLSHPLVRDAGVCGSGDAVSGEEVPVGFVCLDGCVGKDDSGKALRGIQEFLEGRVASYKKLRGGLHHIDVLPKNNSGKLLRKELGVLAIKFQQARAKL